MDAIWLGVLGLVLAALLLLALAMFMRRSPAGADEGVQRALAAVPELAGRLAQMAESQVAQQAALGERLQAQERALSQAVEQRLAALGQQVGERLHQSAAQASQSLTELKERLAVIDAAQRNLVDLSSQVVGLQEILGNKQARGLFGEVQLQNLLSAALAPADFVWQATLRCGRRVDCLLHLPYPPGSIAIDAKFPLEGYRALCEAGDDTARLQARRALAAAVRKHVADIAEKYIVAGETADSALMFLPSEAIYAELHANFGEVVEESYRRRVYIVSPTTMMATLNTVRAVLRDVRMREQASRIQTEVRRMLEDVSRLDDRAEKLQRHFNQVVEDVRQIRISTEKVSNRGQQIEAVELAETAALEPRPAPVRLTAMAAAE